MESQLFREKQMSSLMYLLNAQKLQKVHRRSYQTRDWKFCQSVGTRTSTKGFPLRDTKSKVQCEASKSLDAWGSIMNDVKKQNLMGAHHLLPQKQ